MFDASTAPSPVNRSRRSRGLPTSVAGAWPPGRTSLDVPNGSIMDALTVRITRDNGTPPGTLADADVHVSGGVLVSVPVADHILGGEPRSTSASTRPDVPERGADVAETTRRRLGAWQTTTTNSRAEEHPISTALARRRHAQRELSPPTLTIAAGRSHTAETILRAWFDGKAAHTVRSYRHDLEDFAVYLTRAVGISPTLSVNEALTHLFHQSSPSAHEVALGFRSHLRSARLSAASINRHLATLRSVTKLGRMLGMMTWYLEVPSLKAEQRRDTRGPSVDEVRRMLAATSGDTEAETRDAAILLTFYCLGLRVSELCGLRLERTDLSRGSTWITGKARWEREPVPLPAPVVDAIRRYLQHRGSQAGPLFQPRGHRGKARDGRLAARSVLRIVCRLGQRVGLHVWCHGLRHSSITQAAELGQRAGLGLERIRAHSRHRSIATLMTYVDEQNRTETQRSLSDLVAGTLTTGTTIKTGS